jgi:dihydroorotate dehydrogenase
MFYRMLSKALFQLSPERAHAVSLGALHGIRNLPGGHSVLRWMMAPSQGLRRELFGLSFENPVGIAAGFDKNAEHVEALVDLGFGFIEVGSITARPSAGNPKPRLFRLTDDQAIINRMGLNNAGVDAIVPRLAALKSGVPLFVNVAKSHDANLNGDEAIADYVETVSKVYAYADVLVLNISCPNSGDGRTFEDPEILLDLLNGVFEVLDAESPPLLVKVSPDLKRDQLDAVIDICVGRGVSGFTATNTTVNRDGLKTSSKRLSAMGPGGLSGSPLHIRSLKTVSMIRERCDLPIVGVGGIMGPEEALAFLVAGASLVQLYTGFVFRGPAAVKKICDGLEKNWPALTAPED